MPTIEEIMEALGTGQIDVDEAIELAPPTISRGNTCGSCYHFDPNQDDKTDEWHTGKHGVCLLPRYLSGKVRCSTEHRGSTSCRHWEEPPDPRSMALPYEPPRSKSRMFK